MELLLLLLLLLQLLWIALQHSASTKCNRCYHQSTPHNHYYPVANILAQVSSVVVAKVGVPLAVTELLQRNLSLYQQQTRTLQELHRFITSSSTPIAKVRRRRRRRRE